MTTAAAPTGRQERISEVDIVRGFALFGVLWMNLLGHNYIAMPRAHLNALPTAEIDAVVGLVSRTLMAGKAQALFSMLFGFGFAMLMERIEARGGDARAIYLRRLAILLVIGVGHALLLWLGDILHAYALLGFLLLATRRWPGWLLLGLAVALSVIAFPALSLGYAATGQEAPWTAAEAAGQARRWLLFQGSDYGAFVAENARALWSESYSHAVGYVGLGFIFGRFLIGDWIYRQGWLQDCAAYSAGFRRWTTILLPAGLVMASLSPLMQTAGVRTPAALQPLLDMVSMASLIILALGYGAGIVALCQVERWRARLSPLGAVGQMALTNYVGQSLVFLFVLYGFGLGLLRWNGATFALALAALVFALQIALSRWWLARYRFGPLEWVWRSLTYGVRQPMRLTSATEPAGVAAQ